MRPSVIPPIGVREWLVAGAAGVTVAFSAWGLGGIPAWTLHTLFAGGLLTLLLAICPFPRKLRSPLSTFHFPLESLKRLACWPPFYFSLFFIVYLFVGAMNPAVEVISNGRGWWVEAMPVRLATWLPTSIQSNYEPMNAWRVLVGFSGAFSLMWGLWAGITRRKPVLLVLWMLLLSGAAMGLVGILQHLTEADAVLWAFPSSNPEFWGSFFYRNQGAAYLNLILVASGVLYFYHVRKSRQRGQSGGPHFLCFILFASVVASVALALSRGGIIFAGVLSVAFLTLVFIQGLMGIGHITSFWAALIPLALLAFGAMMLVNYIDLDAIEDRFGDFEENIRNVDSDARYLSSKATWDMAQDRLWLGWGAGSFRYMFPMYQVKYPKIYYYYYREDRGWIGRRVYRYAHNDILQFVAEYGLIGSGMVLMVLLWIVFSAIKSLSFSGLFMLVGFMASMCHAFLDFIFSSPAYWMAFVGFLVAASKLLRLEVEREARRA